MFCKHCGQALSLDQKFCGKCGNQISAIQQQSIEKETQEKKEKGKSIKKSALIILGVIILFLLKISWNTFTTIENSAVDTNNSGLEALNSGNEQDAIKKFRNAADEALTDTNKVGALKNLAYAYEAEERYNEALSAYKEALPFAESGSADYFLISGEIDLLEGNYAGASENYKNALQKNPEDFQINNSLTIFYLDLENKYPEYRNYPLALSHAQKAYESDTEKLATTQQNLAVAHLFNEQYDQSISLLSKHNFTQHPYAEVWLGLAYVGNGDHANGKLHLQNAVNAGVEVAPEVNEYLNSY